MQFPLYLRVAWLNNFTPEAEFKPPRLTAKNRFQFNIILYTTIFTF